MSTRLLRLYKPAVLPIIPGDPRSHLLGDLQIFYCSRMLLVFVGILDLPKLWPTLSLSMI